MELEIPPEATERTPASRMSASLACTRLAYRRLFSGKKQVLAAAVLLLPVVILIVGAIATRITGSPPPDELFFHGILNRYYLSLALILVSIPFALSLTSSDIEDGTASYLFITLLPRWQIALTNVAVAVVVLSSEVILSILTSRLVWRMGTGELPLAVDFRVAIRYSGIALLGMTIFLSFFSFCGYAFRRPVAFSIGAAILWEGMLTVMPVKLAAYTTTNNLRALARHAILEGREGRLFQYVQNYNFPTYARASLTLSTLLGVWLLALAIVVMNRDAAGREAR